MNRGKVDRYGWLSVHRKIINSSVWNDPNPFVLKVWMYCLVSATHSQSTVPRGLEEIIMQPGEFLFSRNEWGKNLGVPNSTVRNILKKLQNWDMIEDSLRDKGLATVYKIKNWEKYQEKDNNQDKDLDNLRTTTGQHKDILNNGNNEKKGYIAEILELIKEITGKSYTTIPSDIVDLLFEDYEPEGVGFALRYFASTPWGKDNMSNFGIKYLLDIEKINEWHRKGANPIVENSQNVQWNPDSE